MLVFKYNISLPPSQSSHTPDKTWSHWCDCLVHIQRYIDRLPGGTCVQGGARSQPRMLDIEENINIYTILPFHISELFHFELLGLEMKPDHKFHQEFSGQQNVFDKIRIVFHSWHKVGQHPHHCSH